MTSSHEGDNTQSTEDLPNSKRDKQFEWRTVSTMPSKKKAVAPEKRLVRLLAAGSEWNSEKTVEVASVRTISGPLNIGASLSQFSGCSINSKESLTSTFWSS